MDIITYVLARKALKLSKSAATGFKSGTYDPVTHQITVTFVDGSTLSYEIPTLTGPQGPKGDKGDTGAQGPKGDKGDTGAVGPKGDKGDTGETGPQGPQGEVGPQGPQGETGPQGEKGDTGPQGEKGDTGEQGPKGDQGEKGETGPKGDKGAAGESAYEIAVEEGYEGTEEEWLASLKGEKGDKGDTGEQGPKGDKGDKGDTGDSIIGTAMPDEMASFVTTQAVGYLDAGTTILRDTTVSEILFKILYKYIAVSGVTLDASSATLSIGEQLALTATVSPDDATDKTVTWASSNSDVATVDENGNVTAIADGTADIIVTTNDGGKTATCAITVSAVKELTVKFGMMGANAGSDGFWPGDEDYASVGGEAVDIANLSSTLMTEEQLISTEGFELTFNCPTTYPDESVISELGKFNGQYCSVIVPTGYSVTGMFKDGISQTELLKHMTIESLGEVAYFNMNFLAAGNSTKLVFIVSKNS